VVVLVNREVEDYWDETIRVLATVELDAVWEAAEVLFGCHQHGGTAYIFGSGGSAATAATSHVTSERERRSRMLHHS